MPRAAMFDPADTPWASSQRNNDIVSLVTYKVHMSRYFIKNWSSASQILTHREFIVNFFQFLSVISIKTLYFLYYFLNL